MENIRNFYKNPEISALMPGKKDFIKMKDDEGIKREIQKRLLLGSLQEIYADFKKEHPGLKIGFSRFASLRPLECVFVRSSGTHTVCVCTFHQNAKLSILGIYSFYFYFNDEVRKTLYLFRILNYLTVIFSPEIH